MSFMSNYYKELEKLKKKEKETDSKVTAPYKTTSAKKTTASSTGNADSFMGRYYQELAKLETEEEDVAPVLPVYTRFASDSKKDDDDKGLDFFKKGLFEDGYDFGDVTKTILGTAGDIGLGIVKGIGGIAEGVADLVSYGVAGSAEKKGHTRYADEVRERAKENFVSDVLLGGATDYVDKYSALGRTSDAVMEGVGQVGAIMATGGLGAAAGLGAVGTTILTTGTMGLSGVGSGMTEAYNSGATDEEARTYGLISGAADAVTELIFGGMGKAIKATGLSVGLSSADDMLAKKVSGMFSNQIAKNFAEFGIKAGAEGFEEVLAGIAQAAGKKATYMSEEDFAKILEDENLLEQFVVGTVTSGLAQSGIVPGTVGGSLKEANKTGRDFVTGLSENEQKVVDKVYKDTIAELEKIGKVTDKAKVYDEVLDQLEKGYISTDTIEEVLGNRDAYDNLVKESEEYKTLYETESGKLSERQKDRLAELKEKNKTTPYDSALQTAKGQLSQDVFNLVKGDRLVESYNEKARRSQVFEADLTQYDEKTQATIQNAINSGTLNNTRRTHELVDFIAKISADKGVLFDFTNNEKIKGTQFAVEGKIVNGYKTDSGITLNVESPKYMQTTVGHEITHVLEGTELYKSLQETIFNYAKSKGEYDSRMADLTELYKNIEGADIEAELTADLVGEYLFQDKDFVNRLSTENRNIFQKIYDEIKYLCRVATAGSKEARELEKVRKAFEDAYRGESKAEGDAKYSLSEIVDEDNKSYGIGVHLDSTLLDNLTPSERLGMVKEYVKELGGESFTAFDPNGNAVDITIAKQGKKFTNQNGKRVPVNKDLATKHIGNEVKQESIALIDELIVAAEYDGSKAPQYPHGWLDNNGQNDWEYWRTYIQDKNNTIWEATLNVANTADGEKILYDISPIKKVGRSVKSDALPTDTNVTQKGAEVKGKFSLSDSEGKQLTGSEIPLAQRVAGDALLDAEDLIAEIEGVAEISPNGYVTVYHRTTEENAKRIMENGKMSAKEDGIFFSTQKDGVYSSDYGKGVVELKVPVEKFVLDDIFDTEAHLRIPLKTRNEVLDVSAYLPAADPEIRYSVSDAQNEKGLDKEREIAFSLSNDTAYADNAIALNQTTKKVAGSVMEDAKALRWRIASRMNDIKDRGLVGLPEDIAGNTYIANSSYDGTEENTTICPRSLASEAFTDAVAEYLGRPLTVEEQIYISQDLQGRSLTPECTYCYVATDRKAYRAFLGEYVAQRDAVLKKVQGNPNADVSRSGELYKEFLSGRKDTNPMYSRFKMWVDAYKNGKPMIDASHLANINKLMGDINSEFGAELKPQIVDAMKYAQSASWAKKRVNYVAYNGHILKWKQDRINKLNSHYGLRMYSFSDFHPAFVLENMQMITDASVRGLKMLGYTKDTDFVEIFAPSGMNINVSTFGFETGGNVYENNLIGAEWEKAKALREQYPNVGVTFVATNDTIVEWALQQDWIDVVIPYHLVRTGAEVAKAFGYTNYTSESSDTKAKEWAKGDKKYIAPTEHNNDKATYLAALEKNHLKPRFERFIDNPNYMKLVNECRQPASESKPVQPVFNEDAAMVALAKLEANGYYQPIGGSVDRMYEIAAEVAEDMTQQIAPAMSLSNIGEDPNQFRQYGTWNVYGKDMMWKPEEIAPVGTVSNTESVAPVTGATEPVEDEEAAWQSERLASLTDADAPPVSDNTPVAAKAESETAKPETKTTRKVLHEGIVNDVKARFAEKGFDFDRVLKRAKNLSTFSTVDNTPQRVMEKALGYKEGQVLSDMTVNKVAQNETEGIKWLNSFTGKEGLLRQISRQYGIKPGSKESAAAQMYAEGFYVDDANEIIQYGNAELAADFPDESVRNNIKRLAGDPRIRKIYDDTLAMINESRTRNAYPEIPRLDNYFLHFRAMEDTFSKLGLPFNPNDIRAKDLPTDLNGVTADLKPGQPFFASAMHRTGKRTSFDLLGGLEKYLTSAKNQIYHIDDIQTLRALRNYIADTYGQANGLEGLDALSEEEQQDRIEKVYNAHLSTFAKFLNEEANILAGKTALIDRGLEGIIGRRGITFLNTVNGQVGKNMVGFNLSSSLTNFLPVTQTFAKTNKYDFVKAFGQTVANKVGSIFGRNDGFADSSPVMIRRKGADSFYRTPYQKVGDAGYAFMSAVDNISTELIARTKYNELTRKGMDSQKAHFETDKWVSRLMGDRSLGQQPQLYNSKMLGLLTKFQMEVRNQLDSQFYDTIQETKVSNEHIQNELLKNAKTAAKITSTFVQLAVVQHLFGKAFESVAGYNPAFDIIEVIMTACGWDDEEESEDTALDNIEQGFLALLEDLPYTSTFTGGRIPISSALPIGQFIKGVDEYGNDKSRWETLGEVAPYYVLPGGYGQIKKTTAGLGMFSEDHPISGSYTDSGNLRFPVEDTLGNRIQAGIFGQYASENARDYFDNERKALNEKQTQEYIELDMPIRDYWDYREGLKKQETLEDKFDYIAGLDVSVEQKNIMINNVVDRKEKVDMDNYDDFGSYEEFDWYTKNTEKYEFLQSNGISYKDYKSDEDTKDYYDSAYEWYNNNPEKVTVSEVISKDFMTFYQYKTDISNFDAKDANGETVSGLKKERVTNYINGLDLDYGQKLILFKSYYDSKADKEKCVYGIVDYLNNRADVSYEEMKTILEEIGYKVDSQGNIYWD